MLYLEVENPGGVLLTVNREQRLYDVKVGTRFRFDIGRFLQPGENEMEIFFTGEKFPFEQVVKSIRIDCKDRSFQMKMKDGQTNGGILYSSRNPQTRYSLNLKNKRLSWSHMSAVNGSQTFTSAPIANPEEWHH
jgi:hypothetical protein